MNEGRGSCESRGLQGSDSGDIWECLCDRDISGNSGAGRSVEIWVFDEGCVRTGLAFFADWWVVRGLKCGRGSWGDVTPEHWRWWGVCRVTSFQRPVSSSWWFLEVCLNPM